MEELYVRGPQGTTAADESPVGADHFFGIDGLVAHGRVDVAVPGDEGGDVRRHPCNIAWVINIRRKSWKV